MEKQKHLWELEYYSLPSDDHTECFRVRYNSDILHIVGINESFWFIIEDITRILHLKDYQCVRILNYINPNNKMEHVLCRSNKSMHKVILLSEEGLCHFIKCINTGFAFDLLAFTIDTLQKYQVANEEHLGRIYARMQQYRSLHVRQAPKIESSNSSVNAHAPVLSASLSFKQELMKAKAKATSVFTLANLSNLRIYHDEDNDDVLWINGRDVLTLLDYTVVAEPESIFKEVPACWLAPIPEGEKVTGQGNLCISSTGLLFYLSQHANPKAVYLFHYVAVQLQAYYAQQAVDSKKLFDLPAPCIHLHRESGQQASIRCVKDELDGLWFAGVDLLKYLGFKESECSNEQARLAFQRCKKLFLRYFYIENYEAEERTGQPVDPLRLLFVSEQGLWYYAGLEAVQGNTAYLKLAQELQTELYTEGRVKSLCSIAWPISPSVKSIVTLPFESQFKTFTLYMDVRDNPDSYISEESLNVFNYLAEEATGISVADAYERYKANRAKEIQKGQEQAVRWRNLSQSLSLS